MLPADQHPEAVARHVAAARIHETCLRLAREEDAAFLLKLRMEPTRSRFISATNEDLGAQIAWMRAYAQRFAAGTEAYFVITDQGVPLGSLRLYDYLPPDNSYCWGSWIILPAAGPTVAVRSLLLAYDMAFGPLGFTQARFDVREGNTSVWHFHERMGAKLVRKDSINRYYEYSFARYQQARPRLAKFAAIADHS